MKSLILLTIPFILGNSAGALGALLPLLIGALIGIGIIGASVWAIIKFFST
jgi:hypothetical protein|tara:strand:+ start:206 stop:358 length:153 start_codon:yes stop_codon:yes gene_type:complete